MTTNVYFSVEGFVYYEADCFCQLRNPYIPPDVDNPTLQQMLQRNLTGPGREEREDVVGKIEPVLEKTRSKEKLSQEESEVVEKFFKLLCGDISRERARVGGNWAIAGTIHFKQHRDIIKSVQCSPVYSSKCLLKSLNIFFRKLLGPDLVIVMLTMPKESVRERLNKRHANENSEQLLEYMMVKLSFYFLNLQLPFVVYPRHN